MEEIIPVTEAVPWKWLSSDGTAVLTNNGLMAALTYEGRDITFADEQEFILYACQVNQILSNFAAQPGWCLHFETRQMEAGPYLLPEPWLVSDEETARLKAFPLGTSDVAAARLIDAIRAERMGGKLYATRSYILPFMRPRKSFAKFMETMFYKGGKDGASLWDQYVRAFHDMMQRVGDQLVRHMPSVSILDSGELYSFLAGCIDMRSHHLKPVDSGSTVEQLFNGNLIVGRNVRLDEPEGLHYRTISVAGLPDEHFPGMIESMTANCPFPVRLVKRAMLVESSEMLARWRKQAENMQSEAEGVLGVLREWTGTDTKGPDPAKMAKYIQATQDLEEAAWVKVGGYITDVAIVAHPEYHEANRRAKAIRTWLSDIGYLAKIETINSLAALIGSFPGSTDNPRYQTLPLVHAVAGVKLSQAWRGVKRSGNILGTPALVQAVGDGCEPFRFDPYGRAGRIGELNPGHVLLFGNTGSGKSTWQMFYAQSWLARHEDGQVIVVEMDSKTSSARIATWCAGGAWLALGGNEASVRLQPLILANEAEARMALEGWIQGICVTQNVHPTSATIGSIRRALIRIASMPQGDRTMAMLELMCDDMDLRRCVHTYADDSPYGQLLSGKQDELLKAPILTVDMTALIDGQNKAALPIIEAMLYAVERKWDGRPTLVIIDETKMCLRVMGTRLSDWLARARKKNVAVCCSLIDMPNSLAESEVGASMIGQCSTRIFLPSKHVAEEQTIAWAEKLGLTRHLAMRLAEMPKGFGVVVHEQGTRLVDFALGPEELAVCGSNGEDNIAAERILNDSGLDGFLVQWLAYKGISHAQDVYRKHGTEYRYGPFVDRALHGTAE